MKHREASAQINSILINTGKMLGILAATVLLCELLINTRLPANTLIMLYILSVLIVSRITPTYVYGLISALLSTLAFDYFITEPRFTFSFGVSIGSPLTLFTMLAVTLLTSTLTIQMQTQTTLAQKRENRAQLLYEINQELLLARDSAAIVSLTNKYLMTHLKCPVIFYTADPTLREDSFVALAPKESTADMFHTEAERKQVHRFFKNGEAESLRPDDGSEHPVYYIPLVSKDTVLGVIGMAAREEELGPGNLTFVKMFTGQITLALELQNLADEQSRILVEAEREKVRGTLLRAISHDLRTPLTSILGASSTILEQKAIADPAYEKLMRDVRDNIQWLIRMVENLLVITRISGDDMKVCKSLEAAEEVVAEAAGIVRKRFPDYSIHIHAPEELLEVPMDATLISQVLINLLENAIKYTDADSLILLDVEKKGDTAQFSISDKGAGIPPQLLDELFEVHSPTKEPAIDSTRGMGIGLSICRTIVQAHGGTIEGFNREGGGAVFRFRLPLAGAAQPENSHA